MPASRQTGNVSVAFQESNTPRFGGSGYFNNLEQEQTELTNFKSEHIEDFHWSFDGIKLGMVRGHTDSDVVLLRESKP